MAAALALPPDALVLPDLHRRLLTVDPERLGSDLEVIRYPGDRRHAELTVAWPTAAAGPEHDRVDAAAPRLQQRLHRRLVQREGPARTARVFHRDEPGRAGLVVRLEARGETPSAELLAELDATAEELVGHVADQRRSLLGGEEAADALEALIFGRRVTLHLRPPSQRPPAPAPAWQPPELGARGTALAMTLALLGLIIARLLAREPRG